MPYTTHCCMDSPLGTLTLVNTDGVLTGLYLPDHLGRPPEAAFGECIQHGFEAATEQLREYFDGERHVFDLPLSPRGTAFQQSVWNLLRTIPYGETRTYGELAAALGDRLASRAVGLANGRNPISIIVPCHRVVGSNGALTGYAGGLDRKLHLLQLEAKATAAQGQLCFL